MAASATSLTTTFSSLSLRNHPSTHPYPTTPFFFITPKATNFPLFIHTTTSNLTPIKCTPDEILDEIPDEIETIFFDNADPDQDFTFNPPPRPEGFIPPPDFDEGPIEPEEVIARAYEELYGPVYSGETFMGNDVYVMDSKTKKSVGIRSRKREKIRDGLNERVVQVRRVTNVVKGGKQLHFRAIVVVGDKQGLVGVGIGKAKEVIAAVQKSAANARRNLINVPMTKYLTFPHRSEASYGAAKVMLRPAAPGTGVIAGGAVRVVLEMAGLENALGKQLGSNNALNNARATVEAILRMRQFSEVAEERGIPMEELWK